MFFKHLNNTNNRKLSSNKKLTVKCHSCGQDLKKYPSEVRDRNFCNHRCYSEFKKTLKGEKNALYIKKVDQSCKKCGKIYQIPENKLEDRKFCSRSCWYEWRKETGISAGENHYRYGKKLSEEVKGKIRAKLLGFKITPEQAVKRETNRKRGVDAYQWKKVEVFCDNCGMTFLKPPCSISNYNFCDKKCHNEWMSKSGVMKGSNNPWYGKTASDEQKRKWSQQRTGEKHPWYGQKHKQETKRVLRLKAIDRVQRQLGLKAPPFPSFNLKSCEWFAEFDKEYQTKGQYATNGGEYHIPELGYWVDYFNPKLKLIMEWDEEHHYINGKLSEKDAMRQKEIQEFYPEFKFERIRELEVSHKRLQKEKIV